MPGKHRLPDQTFTHSSAPRPAKVQKIADMLAKVDSYPDKARDMLLVALPHAQGGEHPFQQEILDMTHDALQQGLTQAEERRADHNAKVVAAEERAKQQEEQCREAAAEEEAATQTYIERQAELDAIQAKLELAKGHYAEMQRQSKQLSKKNKHIFDDLQTSESWQAREISAASTVDANTAEELRKYLAHIKAEPTLVAATSKAAVKSPDQRGNFDELTMSTVQQFLEERHSTVKAAASDAAEAAEVSESMVLGTKAMVDVAQERERAAREQVQVSSDICAAASATLSQVKKRLEAQEKGLREAANAGALHDEDCLGFEEAILRVEHLREGPTQTEEKPSSKDDATEAATARCNPLQAPTPMVMAR